jgi:hypothetical protein
LQEPHCDLGYKGEWSPNGPTFQASELL